MEFDQCEHQLYLLSKYEDKNEVKRFHLFNFKSYKRSRRKFEGVGGRRRGDGEKEFG